MSCEHPALYNSMCVSCGMKIVGTVNSSGPRTTSSSVGAPAAATSSVTSTGGGWKNALNMSGGQVLQLSSKEAGRIQQSKVLGLKNARKLALVLDLDHTLLHATLMDGAAPSRVQPVATEIAGSQELRKQMEQQQQQQQQQLLLAGLSEGGGNEAPAPPPPPPAATALDNLLYHLPIEELDKLKVRHLVMKKRPHLDTFLSEASQFCQMTIYTAGTRRYAEAVARVIDPQRRFFQDRIVSRDDVRGANVRADGNEKSLERIYLGDTSMAVIIDDREDVWQGAQGQQLLLVRRFMHFDPLLAAGGAGSNKFNSTAPPPDALTAAAAPNAGANAATTTATTAATTTTNAVVSPVLTLCTSTQGEPPGRILKTAPLYTLEHSSLDDQLLCCLNILKRIHLEFYSSVAPPTLPVPPPPSSSAVMLPHTGADNNNNNNNNNNNGSSSSSSDRTANGSSININVGSIISNMKSKILAGCTITFSGIIPTNQGDPRLHPLWVMAEELGAQVSSEVLPRTTHLLALQTQTQKVSLVLQRRAADVWVLHLDWLFYCRWSMSRAQETTFMLNQLLPGQPVPAPVMDCTPLPPPPPPLSSTGGAGPAADGGDNGKRKRDVEAPVAANTSSNSGSRNIKDMDTSGGGGGVLGTSGMLSMLSRLQSASANSNSNNNGDSGESGGGDNFALEEAASITNHSKRQKRDTNSSGVGGGTSSSSSSSSIQQNAKVEEEEEEEEEVHGEGDSDDDDDECGGGSRSTNRWSSGDYGEEQEEEEGDLGCSPSRGEGALAAGTTQQCLVRHKTASSPTSVMSEHSFSSGEDGGGVEGCRKDNDDDDDDESDFESMFLRHRNSDNAHTTTSTMATQTADDGPHADTSTTTGTSSNTAPCNTSSKDR